MPFESRFNEVLEAANQVHYNIASAGGDVEDLAEQYALAAGILFDIQEIVFDSPGEEDFVYSLEEIRSLYGAMRSVLVELENIEPIRLADLQAQINEAKISDDVESQNPEAKILHTIVETLRNSGHGDVADEIESQLDSLKKKTGKASDFIAEVFFSETIRNLFGLADRRSKR